MRLDLKLMIVLIAVILVATIGSAYVTSWIFSGKAPGLGVPHETVQTHDYDPELVWDAGTFTVNLTQNGRMSGIVKTSMGFEVNKKQNVRQLEKHRLQIRDRVITVLLMTSSQDLASENGINMLKERLINVVNDLIASDGGIVRDVYFAELVIQQ